MQNWINELKVGDKVIIMSSHRADRVGIVEKITPKGFIKVDGSLYNDFGFEKTTSFFKSHIEKATDEKVEQIRQMNVVTDAIIKMRGITSISYEKAVKILEILK